MLSAAVVALVALVAAGCGGASDTKDATASGGGGGAKLSLVAYSTPQVVYDEIIPAFGKTPDGKGVKFKTSFGPSGDQSRAVEANPHIHPDAPRLLHGRSLLHAAPNHSIFCFPLTNGRR
jgi:ABC-type sulfate transport system substrate-binding protein